jgi:F0F1-type ATP synthase assembly protein I
MQNKSRPSRGFVRKLILIKLLLIIAVAVILYLAWPA